MTIIQLITGLGGGGAEHVVLELARTAQKRGIPTKVLAVTEVREIEQKFVAAGIQPIFLKINSSRELKAGLKRLHEQLRDTEQPVVHCHMFHALMVALLYRLFHGKLKVIFTLHNNVVNSLLRRILLFLTKPWRAVDIIFSENSRKWYLKNSTIVRNGIDLQKFACDRSQISFTKEQPFKFLFLGSLSTQKNPLILPKLAKYLSDEGFNKFQIQVVGDGPLRPKLEAAIEENGVQEYIELFGFRNDADQFLKKAQCQIMPSLWEGMPVSIIEAGASKLPVISTPVGSIPDFLNEQNAYLVEVADFHLSMKQVMIDYPEALKKGRQLFDLVKKDFSIEGVFEKSLALYKSVLR